MNSIAEHSPAFAPCDLCQRPLKLVIRDETCGLSCCAECGGALAYVHRQIEQAIHAYGISLRHPHRGEICGRDNR